MKTPCKAQQNIQHLFCTLLPSSGGTGHVGWQPIRGLHPVRHWPVGRLSSRGPGAGRHDPETLRAKCAQRPGGQQRPSACRQVPLPKAQPAGRHHHQQQVSGSFQGIFFSKTTDPVLLQWQISHQTFPALHGYLLKNVLHLLKATGDISWYRWSLFLISRRNNGPKLYVLKVCGDTESSCVLRFARWADILSWLSWLRISQHCAHPDHFGQMFFSFGVWLCHQASGEEHPLPAAVLWPGRQAEAAGLHHSLLGQTEANRR